MSAQARRDQDRRLAAACIAGSREAWETVVTAHHTSVRFAVIRTLEHYGAAAPDHIVEDLTSQIFLKIAVRDFARLRGYRGQASLKSWFRVLATNHTRDHLRARRPTTELDERSPIVDVDSASPESLVMREQLRAALHDLWQALPDADRAFVEAYFVDERSFEEIAAETGATLGALYARKNRIRKKLMALATERGLLEVG